MSSSLPSSDPHIASGQTNAPVEKDFARSRLESVSLRRVRDEAMRCIQCGFCLPACPTYNVFGEEKHSPRGRIQLVKSWAEGRVEPTAGLLEALDLCLDCRACETACPIDVRYGVVLTGARDELADMATGRSRGPSPDDAKTGRSVVPKQGLAFRWMLRHVAARPKRMRQVSRFTHRLLRSAVGRWVQRQVDARSDSWLGAAITFAAALPAPTTVPASVPAPSDALSPHDGTPTARRATTTRGAVVSASVDAASLFLGCAQEGLFPETNRATADVLAQLGHDVSVPAGQRCCGALHRHHGDKAYARTLAVQNMHAFGAFDETRDDPIVMNAGGCMAWMKQLPELFEPDTAEHRAARRMAARVRDISEMLTGCDDTDARPKGAALDAKAPALAARTAHGSKAAKSHAAPLRVVYQPSCHLSNVCGISEQPLQLLQTITNGCAQLTPDGGSCCGSAGIYNALHPKASKAILDAKMEGIAQAAPDVIVTSNPGCHLQMAAGVRAWGLEDKIRVMQLADFAAQFGIHRREDSQRSTHGEEEIPSA